MKLSDLIKAVSVVSVDKMVMNPSRGMSPLRNDPEIISIHYRSQEVKPGGLFVAVIGHRADGHDYIDDAVRNGAAAVIVEKPLARDIPVIEVADTRMALSALADRFFDHPSKALSLIGITGTNGKTTSAYLVESILNAAGRRTGVIGTIDYRFNGRVYNNPVTTPESLDLQRILAQMREANISHVVLEVSSHAIDLNRIAHCRFDIGIFTNLTQDHLDYHGDMASYWSCKKRFFTDCLNGKLAKPQATAIVNCAHSKGKELYADLKSVDLRLITTGSSSNDAVRPQNVRSDLTGIRTEIVTPAGRLSVRSGLIGEYNLENILIAAAARHCTRFADNGDPTGHRRAHFRSRPSGTDRQ